MSGPAKHYSRKQPTSGAVMQLLDANSSRVGLLIQNAGTVRCHIGDAAVDTTYPYLEPGDVLTDNAPGISLDDWYGIAASGTADLRITEVY
jgi:hypothetical protein